MGQTAVTYPCSLGYATNFAANNQLLKDVLARIDEERWGCSKYCNINNGGYVGLEVNGEGDLTQFPVFLDSKTCEKLPGQFGFASEHPCVCDGSNTATGSTTGPSIYGCAHCAAKIEFEVSSCLDIKP